MTDAQSFKYIADEEVSGIRLDKVLCALSKDLSRSYIQKLISEGNVKINKKTASKASLIIDSGDVLEINVPAARLPEIMPEDIPLDIIYEDEDVIVVNKPKDMVVHPSAGHYTGTLVNALMYHCGASLSGINGILRPGIVHRIDKDTTGSVIVCKNDFSHEIIAEQLKSHSIERRYIAIAQGNIKEDNVTVDKPIGRHKTDRKRMAVDYDNGKSAVTHFRVLERFGQYTYIECKLETGRTHQIRVHLSSMGHPLLGDITYGGNNGRFKLSGQCLHAYILGFTHPRSGEYIETRAPIPEYFTRVLNGLRGGAQT
ncbi:MAG: RluA family pseudouridine synthase [Lachnospiraceae bacterium]|nr:RluA family pseudouridine synthase [Lachnospiraceae bacterium]